MVSPEIGFSPARFHLMTAVADEFTETPSFINRRAADGTEVTDESLNWQLTRLLIPNVAIVVDAGLIHRGWPDFQHSGFDSTTLSLKGPLYENDPHEILLSVQLSWTIGQSGTPAVGAGGPNTLKGLGDLPDSPHACGWVISVRVYRELDEHDSARATP